jgi:hypothetical protein
VTRPPSPSRVGPVPHYAKRVRPKTYSVAVYLVGAIIVLQVAMLISVFWLRAMVVAVNVRAPRAKTQNGALAPEQFPPSAMQPAPIVDRGPELPRLPGLTATTAMPALLKVPTLSDKVGQVSTLNDEAQVLLHQNDLKHAAVVLREAEDLDPRNPGTLKNLAETYYLMNDSVSAKNYWQRLADLGPGVGTVYALAKDHVLLLDSTADANPLVQLSPYPRQTYIEGVEKTPVETSNGQPSFHLRAVLMRKDPKLPFDQNKLQVYVIFYRETPDGHLVPDLSQRKGAFENTFLFWHDKVREPFGVDYLMPATDTGTADAGDYYGFVIGIYYNKILQDVRSEPTDLARRIPLPQAIE